MERDFKELDLYPQDYPFRLLIQDVRDNRLKLNPDFQRKYKRDKEGHERGSKFIESCLMRIPLPVAYFRETPEGTKEVIDGVQRITTIKNFFEDKFALEDLLVFDNLNGKKYSELSKTMQQDLEDYTMRCITLRKTNPEYIVNDIFARLNQGAVKVTPQEVRNAVYPGLFNKLLHELSKIDVVKSFGGVDKDGLGGDELILRYFALKGNLSDYDDKLEKRLDILMKKYQHLEENEINKLRDEYLEVINKCCLIFGKDAFINPHNKKKKQSIVFYDLLMWFFGENNFDNEFLKQNKEKIKEVFNTTCSDPDFIKTLSGGLVQKSSILKRRNIFVHEFNKVL